MTRQISSSLALTFDLEDKAIIMQAVLARMQLAELKGEVQPIQNELMRICCHHDAREAGLT